MAFQPTLPSSSFSLLRKDAHVATTIVFETPRIRKVLSRRPWSALSDRNQEEEDEEDDDEDEIDPDSLGDWRAFRRNLSFSSDGDSTGSDSSEAAVSKKNKARAVSKENEELLKSQSSQLGQEYVSGVWAHETSTPEVGGLVLRMPLEVELFRNYKHSVMGTLLRKKLDNEVVEPSTWYAKAQTLVEEHMLTIAAKAGDDGQIDPTSLDDDASEMLTLYLDNQETWQEVCLVMERNESNGAATTLVLNRPMALKLTDSLGQLVLNGAYRGEKTKPKKDVTRFMRAFGGECAVYIGGPDDQDQPAVLVHGLADLAGANEISPGSGIYQGGIEAAVEGVISGKYQPLDFRFFVGRHVYVESTLDLSVVLGKYQPVACARSVALKQCLSLPKPLWHEVLELCAGELADISELEMLKRDDLKFEIIDEDDEDEDDDDDSPDELDELDRFDDEDDEYYSST